MALHRTAATCFSPGHSLPRVLIAEDDELLRRFLIQGLGAAGFAVVAAADGDEALRRFDADGPFDALVLDEEMPVATGRDVLRRLRSRGEGLPALMFSGQLTLDESERVALGIEAGELHEKDGESGVAHLAALRARRVRVSSGFAVANGACFWTGCYDGILLSVPESQTETCNYVMDCPSGWYS